MSTFHRRLATSRYTPSEKFKAITEHTAVCFALDGQVVAVTGKLGEKESEDYARLFAVSPHLLLACKCALADLEGLTGYNHKRLPAPRKNEKPALTTIRELAAAIQAAEPEGN